MQQSIENKTDIKNKILNFYNLNKIKIYALVLILLIILISAAYLKYDSKKKNDLIAEKYIQAGIYIALNKKDEAKVLYEEIILSKNKFYSILSFNTILEKKLISDKNKILNYFKTLEEIISNEDQKDLIIFKKALYLIKTSDLEGGKKQLDKLRKKNSKLKSISDELISK